MRNVVCGGAGRLGTRFGSVRGEGEVAKGESGKGKGKPEGGRGKGEGKGSKAKGIIKARQMQIQREQGRAIKGAYVEYVSYVHHHGPCDKRADGAVL